MRDRVTSRRGLLRFIPGIVLLAVSPALAQPRSRPARVAILDDGRETSRPREWRTFRKRLIELAYVEGKTLVLDVRWANTDLDRLPALAAELVLLKPDVIVTPSTPSALAAKRASSSIPIVVTGSADPVKAGLLANLARPDGNVTGITPLRGDIAGKQFELLREVSPKMKSVAFLTHTANPGSMQLFRDLQEQARPLGVMVKVFDASSRSKVEGAFIKIAKEKIEALIVSAATALLDQRQAIVDGAARQRIPALYARRDFVDAGGLMSYSAIEDAIFSRGAEYVHRILQGAKPSDLPFEQASTFKLILNLKTARTFGMKFPQTILVRADEVIE